MSDRDAFLRATREHPDDDTVRLVFADWLDDRGDPLGGFIRLQIELEPIRDQLDNPRVQELTEREAVLLGTHGHDWLGPAADLTSVYPAFGPVFRRGLPEMVCLSLDTFLRRGGELFAACPTVREVCLYGVAGRGADLADCPHLKNVETLEIADWLVGDDERDIGQRLPLTRIGTVRVWATGLEYDGLDLYLSDWAGRLELVDLSGSVAAPDDVREGRFASEHAVRALNHRLGRVAAGLVAPYEARLVAPYEARFPLAADIGHGLYPGTNNEVPTVLAIRKDQSGVWVTFDRGGRERGTSEFGGITHPAVEVWRTHHAGSVRVREFVAEQFSLRLWPQEYVRDYLQNPFDRPAGVSNHWWASRGGVLKRWLHEGRFVIEWDGREYTADATGKIVAR
jgi:uncharacterized protein (TIGR02996 family)